ncbi:MAG: glycosyltransferase family 9 protein [bacterium]
MNIKFIRKIDYYAGPTVNKLLLLLMAVHEKLCKSSKTHQHDLRRILVIKLFGMGSILLFSPSLRLLKKKYPQARVAIFTLFNNKRLCEIIPTIDEVVCLNIDTVWHFITSFTAAVRYIRKKDFDVIIDLEFLTNFSASVSLLASLFLRHKTLIGFNSPLEWRNKVHTINIAFSHSAHITKIFLKVVRSLGVENEEISFGPEKTALLKYADNTFVESLLADGLPLDKKQMIVAVNINAGALSFHRRWPKEYFAQIIQALLTNPKITIVLIGGKEDAGYVSDFKKGLPSTSRIVDLSGKTRFVDLVSLFRISNLLITNDSGPLHLAAIVGLDTISFFGPETPHLYGPPGGNHFVLFEDMFCSPCLNIYNSKVSRCSNNLCLRSIKPEKVLHIIEHHYT